MRKRDRSRRAQLQALLGDLGTVLPYASRAGRRPAPGWYLTLGPGAAVAGGGWQTDDGALYAGVDTAHAAATIGRVYAVAQP